MNLINFFKKRNNTYPIKFFATKYKDHICIAFTLVVYAIILNYFDIFCPFYELTHVPCPGCGMSRAIWSLFRGEIRLYFSYNLMAIPVVLAFVMEIFNEFSGKINYKYRLTFIIIYVVNILYYLIRLFLYT